MIPSPENATYHQRSDAQQAYFEAEWESHRQQEMQQRTASTSSSSTFAPPLGSNQLPSNFSFQPLESYTVDPIQTNIPQQSSLQHTIPQQKFPDLPQPQARRSNSSPNSVVDGNNLFTQKTNSTSSNRSLQADRNEERHISASSSENNISKVSTT